MRRSRSIVPTVLTALLIALVAAPARASGPLELDRSFGRHGLVSPGHSVPGFEEVAALAIAPGRHIYLAAESSDAPGAVVLARYYRGGESEPSFGTRGYLARLEAGPVSALTVDNLRVLLLSRRTRITRLTKSGQIDPSFGEGGTVRMDRLSSPLQSLHLWSLAQLTGGSVAAAGISFGAPQMVAIKLRPDGSLDPAFNGSGWVAVRFGGGTNSGAFQMKTQPDGKIVLAGYADGRPALARLLPDGRPDQSFGRNGRVLAPRWLHGQITALTVRRDGSILVGARGWTRPGTGSRALLLRYGSTGRLDRDFGAIAAPRSRTGAGATPICVVRGRRHIFMATRGAGPSVRAYDLHGRPLRLGKVPGVPEDRFFHVAAAPQLGHLILAWTPDHAPGQGVVNLARFELR
jgi:uncharacterized delta-60 repeat protein